MQDYRPDSAIAAVIHLRGVLEIRFDVKHLFSLVLVASLVVAIASAFAESRSWGKVKDAEFLLERAVLNIGYDVAERFDVDDGWGPFFGTENHANRTPYKFIFEERVESRDRILGSTSSANQRLFLENEIDVNIECVVDFTVVDTGSPKMLIYDNKAPSNDWFIPALQDHLESVFARFGRRVEVERRETLDVQRTGG